MDGLTIRWTVALILAAATGVAIGLIPYALDNRHAARVVQTPQPARVAPPPGPAAPAAGTLNRIKETAFGKMGDGSAVKLFTLSNAKGMKARICTFGATIAGILAPDRNGKLTNVVATADNLQALQDYGMLGNTMGRVANRIAGAKFTLDGKDYTLQANSGVNSLHSGNSNFGTKNWEGQALPLKEKEAHEAGVALTFVSKDGDGGFPGNLTLTVTITLSDDNELRLDYQAACDKSTPINITNHAFFNLAGAAGFGTTTGASTADQELWIDADKSLVCQNMIPTGQMNPVKNTALDFTKAMALGARAAQQRTYDHTYVFNSWADGKGPDHAVTVARLRDPKSGREMEVRTDQPGMQLNTSQARGIALETQHFPDSVHHDNFPSTILQAGGTFKSTTIYAFSAK